MVTSFMLAMSTQTLIRIAVMGATFGLVLSLWCAVVLLWSARRRSRTKKVEQRLGLVEQETGPGRVLTLWRDGKEITTIVPTLSRKGLAEHLERLRRDAGWVAPIRSLVLGVLAVTALLFAGMLVATGRLPIAMIGALGAPICFWLFAKQRMTRRVALFDRQLVDALDLAARSLRAGHPLIGSFRLIAEEVPAPVGPLFGEICQQQSLGMGMDESLRRAAADSESPDLKLFATSVIIQLRGGGNLADMMERVAFVMRERMRLVRRVRVLTAQTQFSKNTLLALPFIVFIALNILNPEYMKPLYSTAGGQLILMVAASGLVVGALIMNRLAQLKF